MNVHLFTTDISALLLAAALPADHHVTALIIPENRERSDKVANLVRCSRWPVFVHRRGDALPENLPPAEVGLSWLYSQILAPSELARYPRGILNMHGGKIPDYRGANVLQWAIIQGESELGITWHEMADEVDAGLIWHESTIPIPASATGIEMRSAMLKAGMETFPVAWENFYYRRGSPRRPDLNSGRIWPQRKADDGKIRPGLTERQVRNLVRALSPPWPSATVSVNGEDCAIRAIAADRQPGRIPYICSDGPTLFLMPENGR